MKVCTDACLFGAVLADKFSTSSAEHYLRDTNHRMPVNILDIGTGTGLLPLMFAQKCSAYIDAIEIDELACSQAKENIISSKWAERINVIHADVTHYKFDTKYHVIISNPPFFENDLVSSNAAANMARHHHSLTLSVLIETVAAIILPGGIFAVLLPFHRTGYFTGVAASSGLHLHSKINVRQSASHPFFRSILFMSNTKPVEFSETTLVIREGEFYSTKFMSLLGDFYLQL